MGLREGEGAGGEDVEELAAGDLGALGCVVRCVDLMFIHLLV